MSISKVATSLRESEIIKIAGEINVLKQQGQQIANLTIGDFDPNLFPIPVELKELIKQAYDDGYTNYPPADGIPALRNSVSKLLKDRYAIDYNSSEILVSSGARPLIYAAYTTLVDPGDKVVYPAPSWNNNHYCDLIGARGIAVASRVEDHFMPTAQDIKAHIGGATLLALCSPLNPTGTMFSQQALEEICDVVLEENSKRKEGEKPLYLLYDQIYSLLTFNNCKHVDPVYLRPEMKKYTIYIDGASKCFASTGVRVGWGFGPQNIIAKMRVILMHMGAWAPKPEQQAMATYLTDTPAVNKYLNSFRQNIQNSLTLLYNEFRQLKEEGLNTDAVEPMGAIYLTVKIDYSGKTSPDGKLMSTSEDISLYLIKEAGAAFVPFSAFGAATDVYWFRASVGACSTDEIKAMMPRIRQALEKLS